MFIDNIDAICDPCNNPSKTPYNKTTIKQGGAKVCGSEDLDLGAGALAGAGVAAGAGAAVGAVAGAAGR